MNNNFYEIPNDWYSGFNNSFMNQMDNMNNFNVPNMGNDLVDPKIGLDRGNLFSSLYDPYKNYKYRPLKASNKREELLIDILKHNFALTELNLYLDINPMDMNIIGLYNRYLDNKKQLVDVYEKNYGPLTLDGLNMGSSSWNWDNSPWPWEGTK